MKIIRLITLLFLMACKISGQQVVHYNLAQMLQENKLDFNISQQTEITNGTPGAISSKGVIWLKDVDFTEGTIDIDLRGKNVFLQSFPGIAFHAKDTVNYEVVYFRPFNFRHTDTLRRKWSVQYMFLPQYDYEKLRKSHPLVYENAVTPVPGAEDWFHVTIAVKVDSVTVFVNHSTEASLKVKKLNPDNTGMIGLWDDGLSGDFAHLTITR